MCVKRELLMSSIAPRVTMSVVYRVATAGVVVATLLWSFSFAATSAELWIGTATADITPEPPVAQERVILATTIRSPCLADVLVLESRQGGRAVDQTVLVSCDLCLVPGIQEGFRKYLAGRQPDNVKSAAMAVLSNNRRRLNVPEAGVVLALWMITLLQITRGRFCDWADIVTTWNWSSIRPGPTKNRVLNRQRFIAPPSWQPTEQHSCSSPFR